MSGEWPGTESKKGGEGCHRDIKPANSFLSATARIFDFVKVLDFGLVKKQKVMEDAALTQEGQFLGAPAFLRSP